MPDENLREEIKEMMVENLMLKVSKEEIADDLPLFGPGGLGLDSIDALELIVLLQQHYKIKLSNADDGPKVFKSVRTMADYIRLHQPENL